MSKLSKVALATATAFLAGSSTVLACTGTVEHNLKYHGNPTCSQCTCAHYRDPDRDNGTEVTARAFGVNLQRSGDTSARPEPWPHDNVHGRDHYRQTDNR